MLIKRILKWNKDTNILIISRWIIVGFHNYFTHFPCFKNMIKYAKILNWKLKFKREFDVVKGKNWNGV